MALVSRTSSGGLSGRSSDDPSMSADGRYVAFLSSGALLSEDVNGVSDVYVYDRQLRTVNADGTGDASASGAGSMGHSPAWSPDGSRLTYIREHVVYSADPHGSDVRGLLSDFSRIINGFDWAVQP